MRQNLSILVVFALMSIACDRCLEGGNPVVKNIIDHWRRASYKFAYCRKVINKFPKG